MTQPSAVHVVPADGPKGRDHTPSKACWCGPIYLGTDLSQPGLVVFRHRTPPTEKRYRVEPSRW